MISTLSILYAGFFNVWSYRGYGSTVLAWAFDIPVIGKAAVGMVTFSIVVFNSWKSYEQAKKAYIERKEAEFEYNRKKQTK